MPPKSRKGKEKVGSSSGVNDERFKDAEFAGLFESKFNNRTVIFERIVVSDGIVNSLFMQWLRLNRLVTLSSLNNECFEDWVREFYCNIYEIINETNNGVILTGFKTYVRGKTLFVTPDSIATLLKIPRPAHRLYPFQDGDNIVVQGNEVASVLCGRPIIWNSPVLKISELTTDYRMLNTFACHNIEPRGHKSDLHYSQAFLLYTLATGTSVDVPLTIFESMLRIYHEPRKRILPFGAMICKMMILAGCQAYSHESPVSKRMRIDARTMNMSNTHVQGRLRGEQAQVEVDEEAGSMEDRLSAVEHAVFDQSVQIEHLEERMAVGFSDIHNQLEERMASGFSDIRNQLTEMFNQLRHQ